MDLRLTTTQKRQVVDITSQMQDALTMNFSGVACASVLHTTAALTTADLDPGTDLDLLDALNTLITERKWRHPHNPAHAPDHLLASIIGPSVTVPARDGRLMLGAWQRVVLIELDGPRTRNLSIMLLPSVTS